MNVVSSTSSRLSLPKPRVLVSVLSYNSAADIVTTLKCIERQTYPNLHLQVLDNCSTNDLVDRVKKEFPTVNVRVLDSNRGYTGGSNVVLKQCVEEGYDYVILCNDDIEVTERAVEYLVETAQAFPNAGTIGCIEANMAGKVRAIDGGQYCGWTSSIRRRSSIGDVTAPSIVVPTAHGAMVLFTKKAIESGVLMDENLFMFFDEVDIGFQLAAKHFKAYTDRRVIVRHKSVPYQKDEYVGYLSQRNRLYIVRKYGRWYHRLFYYGYSSFIELPVKTVIRSLQGYPRFALACIIGHFDALKGRMERDRVLRYMS